MTPDRFFSIVASHGAASARWPAAERDAAEALARTDPACAAALAEAARLDAALAAWTVPAPGAALAGRIATIPAGRRATPAFARFWREGIGAAAALASGVAVGAIAVAATAPPPEPAGLYATSVLGSAVDLEAGAPAEGEAP